MQKSPRNGNVKKCPTFDITTISKIYMAIKMPRYRTYIKKIIQLLLKGIKQELNKSKAIQYVLE